ncbi:MAG: hypothetical protein ACTHU0_01415 [Kofleriaceae bacterium]
MRTVEELQHALDPRVARAAGAIRRMAVSLTARVLWQLVGFQIPGARGASQTETASAEPFLGIGFHARPPSSGKPEAIVLMVGDAQHPVVVAVRDEKTRAAVAGALAENETAMFNSRSVVHIKADGTIEARSAGGTAGPLALHASLVSLREAFQSWTPVTGDGGAALKTVLSDLFAREWPKGTTKLKGE